MLSTEQKTIIRQICEEQEGSLLRVSQYLSKRIREELFDEEGLIVSEADIAEEIAKDLEKWDEVKQNPEKFLELLDDTNLGMVKHHLVQDFIGVQASRKIWKQLNLFDKANEFRN